MPSTSATKMGCISGPSGVPSSRFLELPRELRDRIYIAVLRTSAPPPSFPFTRKDRTPSERFCGQDFGGFERSDIYPGCPLPSTTSTLLTLNRQVRTEVKEIMSRNEITRPLTYKLDCVMVDEKYLYPTWLSIPALSSSVDVVQVNFRLFKDLKGKLAAKPSERSRPYGVSLGMIGRLFLLLERFLRSGPSFLALSKPPSCKIGELVLNVVTPEEPPDGFIAAEPHFFGALGIQDGRLVNKETVGPRFGRFLQIGRFLSAFPERNRVRELVRVIRICLDGNEVQTWDMQGLLVEFGGLNNKGSAAIYSTFF